MFKPPLNPNIAKSEPSNPPKKPKSRVYEVLWRKKSTRKHKNWENDGTATIERNPQGNFILKVQLNSISTTKIPINSMESIKSGTVFSAGSNEVQISEDIQLTNEPTISSAQPPQPAQIPLPKVKPPPQSNCIPKFDTQPNFGSVFSTPFVTPFSTKRPEPTKQASTQSKKIKTEKQESPLKKVPAPLPPTEFSTPLLSRPAPTLTPTTIKSKFDLAMVSPLLAPKLRPHQIEAVEFMYNCVQGLVNDGEGCILADEMGLGKTLSSITLIDTLLSQKAIGNCLIVCPATLVGNWKQEFQKWLPFPHTPNILTCDGTNQSVADPLSLFFQDSRKQVFTLMIMSYERVRLETSKTASNQTFDLVVCDEAHRLKSSKSKTVESLMNIINNKRVLLTGTPIQNDLMEFYALADFANYDCLGKEKQFRKQFIDNKEIDFEELNAMCAKFMLRRTSEVLLKYVDVERTEYAVFIRPNETQKQMYQDLTITRLSEIGSSVQQSEFLSMISELRKSATGQSLNTSSKLDFLKQFLYQLKTQTEEKVVVVSNSTRVLDMCQSICASEGHTWLRLDGSTPASKRATSVKMFNKQSQKAAFVFLLSTRSGGAGLNLIGASRLVLMDCDWNPAADIQAMARIHRDGQKHPCFIYRLFTTGTIDEKMFQRQLNKVGLSNDVLAQSASNTNEKFTIEQIKDLFTFSQPPKCDTLIQRSSENDLNGFRECTAVDEVLGAIKNLGISCILKRT